MFDKSNKINCEVFSYQTADSRGTLETPRTWIHPGWLCWTEWVQTRTEVCLCVFSDEEGGTLGQTWNMWALERRKVNHWGQKHQINIFVWWKNKQKQDSCSVLLLMVLKFYSEIINDIMKASFRCFYHNRTLITRVWVWVVGSFFIFFKFFHANFCAIVLPCFSAYYILLFFYYFLCFCSQFFHATFFWRIFLSISCLIVFFLFWFHFVTCANFFLVFVHIFC